jgi:two-component system nitrate/nitrite response regulator NarL
VVIADRHPMVLQGLAHLVNSEKNFQVIAGCRSSTEFIRAILNESPDIALVVSIASGITGFDILAAISAAGLLTRVVFLAASPEFRELIIASASNSCGPLTEAGLVQTLRQALIGSKLPPPALTHDGVSQRSRPICTQNEICIQSLALLTEREREITFAVADGLSNKEVGRRLNISEGTIKVHLHNIYRKLSISNRTALVALAVTHLKPT